MGAVTRPAVAGLRRRRLQATVLAMVLFLATAAATVALTILVESRAPFDRAFERANGAHLVIDYAASVGDAQLATTTTAAPVTASAGPWPVSIAVLGRPFGGLGGGAVISGRDRPDTSVDTVAVSAGRWWRGPGEVVLDEDTAVILDAHVDELVSFYAQPARTTAGTGPDGPGLVLPGKGDPSPTGPAVRLTVVGIAASVSTPRTAAWMSPSDLSALAGNTPPSREMLYRVDPAATAADLSKAAAIIADGVTPDVVTGTVSYLDTRNDVDRVADLYVPVLLAFALFALLAAAFTIANVVAGVVLTAYREIGVMKAIGYTPAQVTTILMTQIALPAIVGATAGVVVGTFVSRPTVERTVRSFGLPSEFVPSASVVAGVFVVSIGVALLAAIGPAVRAGRLSAVGAITRGSSPSTAGRGGRRRRFGLLLPGPLPFRLGVAMGLAHPLRTAMTLGALVVGVGAVTFAITLNLSLVRVMGSLDRNVASPVRVTGLDPSVDPDAITAEIASDPDTARSVALTETSVSISGAGAVPFVGYTGDASWIGYALVRGRWFAGPGEIVAPTRIFTRTGLSLGDTLDLVAGGRTITLRLVGEIFDTADETRDQLVVRGSAADATTLDPAARPTRWEVQPKTGVPPQAYASDLRERTAGRVATSTIEDSSSDEGFLLFLSVIAFLGVVLVAISLGGVFDTVLLETHQRIHELAVLKALGLGPAQVVAMVVASILPVALLAGVIGVPLGLVLQRIALATMGETAAGLAIPDSMFAVVGPFTLAGLGLTGLAIGAAGAFVPARRAARARIAPVLQAE